MEAALQTMRALVVIAFGMRSVAQGAPRDIKLDPVVNHHGLKPHSRAPRAGDFVERGRGKVKAAEINVDLAGRRFTTHHEI